MVHARYAKSRKHKKLKSVDPANQAHVAPILNARRSKKQIAKEKARIKKMTQQHMSDKMGSFSSGRYFSNFMDEGESAPPKKRKKNGQSLLKVTTHMNEGDTEGATRPLKSIPETLQQGPYESQQSFLKRLDKLCNKVRGEARVEEKYGLGDKVIKDETKISNRILRRRERDKKRKSKRKKNTNRDDDFPKTESNVFLPA